MRAFCCGDPTPRTSHIESRLNIFFNNIDQGDCTRSPQQSILPSIAGLKLFSHFRLAILVLVWAHFSDSLFWLSQGSSFLKGWEKSVVNVKQCQAVGQGKAPKKTSTVWPKSGCSRKGVTCAQQTTRYLPVTCAHSSSCPWRMSGMSGGWPFQDSLKVAMAANVRTISKGCIWEYPVQYIHCLP